jgi:hypothetical protein
MGAGDVAKATGSGAATGAMVGGPYGALIGGAIGAGTSILSSIFQSRAQDRANRAIQRSLEKASTTFKDEFAKTERGFSPYTKGGAEAFAGIAEKQKSGYYDEQFDMNKFNQDPGVAYRQQQANNALDRSASSRGRTLSGGTLRSIADLNQSLASQEYGAAYERFRGERKENFDRGMQLGQVGLDAEGTLASHRSNLATSLADLQTTGGTANAKRNLGQGDIYSDLTASLGDTAQSMYGGAGARNLKDLFRDRSKDADPVNKRDKTGRTYGY